MKGKVQLPNEQLIDYLSFCKAIAEGICPADEKERKGIDCIVGKQITVLAASIVPFCQDKHKRSYGSSASDRPRSDLMDIYEACISYPTSNEKSEEPSEDFSMPFKLTDEDREWMKKLLPILPSLKYPLSKKVADEFMRAYSSFPDRPEWSPLLITTEHVQKLKDHQDELACRHHQALLNELALGTLVAVTADHVKVRKFAMGVFIPRKEAIAYLDRSGIPYEDLDLDDALPQKSKTSEIKPRTVGEPKFTAKEKKAIVAFRQEKIDEKTKGYTTVTAEEYGISTSMVRRYVREAKKEAEVAKNALSSRVVKHR